MPYYLISDVKLERGSRLKKTYLGVSETMYDDSPFWDPRTMDSKEMRERGQLVSQLVLILYGLILILLGLIVIIFELILTIFGLTLSLLGLVLILLELILVLLVLVFILPGLVHFVLRVALHDCGQWFQVVYLSVFG